MMTDKDCADFSKFVQVLQNNAKKDKVKRPTHKDQQIMALYKKIKDLNEISEAHQKLNGKLRLRIKELEDYVRKIKSTTSRTCCKATRKSKRPKG
jgi:predicted RNase H-like nuclease (RuvC/YqgF family)